MTSLDVLPRKIKKAKKRTNITSSLTITKYLSCPYSLQYRKAPGQKNPLGRSMSYSLTDATNEEDKGKHNAIHPIAEAKSDLDLSDMVRFLYSVICLESLF